MKKLVYIAFLFPLFSLSQALSSSTQIDITKYWYQEPTGYTYPMNTFVPSGDVDLSAYAGQTVYIAFRYLGADGGITTTYQIDNVSLTAN